MKHSAIPQLDFKVKPLFSFSSTGNGHKSDDTTSSTITLTVSSNAISFGALFTLAGYKGVRK